jgi:hypothetical protein
MAEIDGPNSASWKTLRPDVNMYVFVDVQRAVKDGMKFYRSTNNVILTEGVNGVIPPQYLTLAKSVKANVYGFIVGDLSGKKTAIVTTHNGQMGFPKGKKHKQEHGLACAYRELYEETGLLPKDIIVHDHSGLMENKILYYRATCPVAKELRCQDPEELLHAGWFSIVNLRKVPEQSLRSQRMDLINQCFA